MRGLLVLLIAAINVYLGFSQRGGGECAHACNELRHDVLTLEMCK